MITAFNQKECEIDRLMAELAQYGSKVEDANKVHDDVVKQLVDKADDVKKLEERLEEVRGLSRDLNTAGAEKDQKLQRHSNSWKMSSRQTEPLPKSINR